MTAATKKAPAPKPAEKSTLEYLQHALEDLAHARERAQQDARAGIDSAVERIRGVRKDMGARAHDEAEELQTRLEHASDDALMEFGRAAVRAQRTPEALPRCRRRSATASASCSSDPPHAPPREAAAAARRDAVLAGAGPGSSPSALGLATRGNLRCRPATARPAARARRAASAAPADVAGDRRSGPSERARSGRQLALACLERAGRAALALEPLTIVGAQRRVVECIVVVDGGHTSRLSPCAGLRLGRLPQRHP